MSLGQRQVRTRRGATIALTTFGFGAAPLGNMHRKLDERDAVETVETAWEVGFRYFDTAPLYGHGLSETRLGNVLTTKPRTDFAISTKVGRVLKPCESGGANSGIYVGTPDLVAEFDYSYDGVMRSVEASFRRLKLDRVDIIYVHDVDSRTHGSASNAEARIRELFDVGGWRALDELRASGAVHAIGAGVNENEACERLLDLADPDIFLLAGRFTLLDQSAARVLLPACLERGVSVVLGGPYNSGILATGPVDGAWYDYAPASSVILERTRAIAGICAARGVELAHAALHFPLTHPAIVSVIPGSQSRREVVANSLAISSPPPERLWADLAASGLISSEHV